MERYLVAADEENQRRSDDFQDFAKEHCCGIEELISLKTIVTNFNFKSVKNVYRIILGFKVFFLKLPRLFVLFAS